MSFENICENLTLLINKIEANPNVSVSFMKLGSTQLSPTVAKILINGVEGKNKYKIPDDYRQIITSCGNLGVSWVSRNNGEFIGGEFFLKDLFYALTNPTGNLTDEFMTNEQVEIVKRLGIFDDHPNSGDNRFAAFKIVQGEFPPEIWFYDRGEIYKMKVNLKEYLNALLLTKGIANWQYFFCGLDLNLPEFVDLKKMMDKSLRMLKTLFPDEDYSSLYHWL